MSKFFVPGNWNKNSNAIVFDNKNVSKSNTKNKKKNKKKAKVSGKDASLQNQSKVTTEIKAGRIEKNKKKKQKKIKIPSKDTTTQNLVGISAKTVSNVNAAQTEQNKKKKQKKNKAAPQLDTTLQNSPKANNKQASKIKAGRIEKINKKKEQKNGNISVSKKNILLAIKDDAKDAKESAPAETVSKNNLQARLQEQLMGGRFRFLNEQLYTLNSGDAMKLFKEDANAFDAYHAGYRHQVEKWPLNPLKRIIKTISRLPKALVIGDFGCGEGKLAKSVPHQVFSMDLVSCRDDIIACDMAMTPLQTQSLDVAVYCLSLMGTNLRDYLLEANRVLKIDGIVLIAEIQSRFDNVREFTRCMESCGFELTRNDLNTKLFYFFEFKKVRNVGKVAIVAKCELKPCLYRKR